MRIVMVGAAVLIAWFLAAWTIESRSVRCCWFGHRPLQPDWQSRCRRCGLDAWQQLDDDAGRSLRWFLLIAAGVALAWAS